MKSAKNSKCIIFPSVRENGLLFFLEAGKQIPFTIKRVFYILDMPEGRERGKHANKKTKEVLCCLHGSVKVVLNDGVNKSEYILREPGKGIFIKNMTWVELKEFKKNTVLLCVASKYYDEKDYIYAYDEFLTAGLKCLSQG